MYEVLAIAVASLALSILDGFPGAPGWIIWAGEPIKLLIVKINTRLNKDLCKLFLICFIFFSIFNLLDKKTY